MADKSKRKILYIITKSVWGGAGKYVYDLATHLPKDSSISSGQVFEVFVGAGGHGELAKKLIAAGITYFEIKNFQRDIKFLKEFGAGLEIILLLFKIRPDIIHVNSSKAGGIAGIAILTYKILNLLKAKGCKLKTVFTAHGWAFHENKPFWQILLIRLFSTLTCFYYSRIICVSEFDRQSAIKKHIASNKKLTTIHNGIDYDEYNFFPREEARKRIAACAKKDLSQQKIWIGTIGEFTKNKGQKYLIDSIKSLIARYPSLITIIIGWGEEILNLKSQVSKLKLEDNVFIINGLPSGASYLKAFDIFVLPSIKEGLPYTLLEAGLAGLPVISTKVGGIPEIIEHDEGILAEPANATQLAEKIEELINNPEKRKIMSSALWQKILKEFSFEKMLNITLAAYEQNCGRRNNY